MAIADFQQNRVSESTKNVKTALRLAEASENGFEAHHAAESLVVNYTQLGELDSALSYASRMVSFKGTYYENPAQWGRDLGTLTRLCGRLNFLATSLSLAQERLSIVQENENKSDAAGDSYTSRVNDALGLVISASAAKKDFAEALNYGAESKRVALTRANSAERTRTIAEIHLTLADVKSQMNDCNQATADYDEALRLFSDLPEVTFALYRIHKGKLFCFQAMDQQENFARELKAVLKLSEEYRTTIREDKSRQAFFANEQVVFDAAAANAFDNHDDKLAFAFVEESRARSLLDFIESDKPLAEAGKGFASVSRPLSLAEIQSRLPEPVVLVQYAVLPDKLVIWLLSKTRFESIERTITAAELEARISDYQAKLISRAPAAEVMPAAKALYDLLIPNTLKGDEQLCLVPDKSLHQLAFASLVSPNGKYLLQDFPLFYAPSASVFVLTTESARRKERSTSETVLSVGNPAFDREENVSLPDLPTAEAEAKEIATQYTKARELLGTAATKDNFLHELPAAEVIHFAGHFVANQQSPGNSKFLFAGGELRSSELARYKLPRAKLVVLSACETGFERYDRSEGAIGVARTFLALGAPLVVASQWQVDSEQTKDLMIQFHQNRRAKHLATAASLRQAQLDMLSRDATKAPFYWAAFSLFGGYASY